MAQERSYCGSPASPGFAVGKVFILRDTSHIYAEPALVEIPPEGVEKEIQRFRTALEEVHAELLKLQQQLQTKVDAAEARIFDAHLLIVDDKVLMEEVVAMIQKKHIAAQCAFYRVIERYVSAIMMMPDSYIKERAADIRDVAMRVICRLENRQLRPLRELRDRYILLADDLTPSDTAGLDRDKVLGFAVSRGSKTSHTAILARSMRLPALVGLDPEALSALHDGDEIILDGFSGRIIADPDPRTTELYRQKIEEENRIYSELTRDNELRPETLDGFMIQLSANIESLNDLPQLQQYGACGIGLFRTEYLFLGQDHLPSEEEQYLTYRKLLECCGNDPVIIRTLDIGGDKFEHTLQESPEPNPFLGLRGIRFCLHARRDVLRMQLRALLRAASHGRLRVMLPMISCVEEVLEVKALIRELAAELEAEKIPAAKTLELGAMIETPVAALMVSSLAGIVDFFSIGTNDLIQYTMAIDRSNEKVAYLYQPTHPAILELIWRCAQEAKRHNIYVSVCGQIAGDARFTALLLGLGVHELSMPPAAIAPVRRVIRKTRMYEAEAAAEAAISCSTADEALQIAVDLLNATAPEILQLVMH